MTRPRQALAAVAAGALALAGCGGSTTSAAAPPAGGPLPAHYVAVCGPGVLTVLDPTTGRVRQQRPVTTPSPQAFQPTVRQDSAASRLAPTVPPPTDCGTWSYDGTLTHLAGSSQGRLATFTLADGTVTFLTPAVQVGADSPVCCDAYDPTGEAVWWLHAGPGSTPRAPTFQLVGPDGTAPTTYFGTAASLAFVAGAAVPSVGAATPVQTAANLEALEWRPLSTDPATAPPPPLPVDQLDYGLAGTLVASDLQVGVLRHADTGAEVAFVGSAGRDCTLYTVPVGGGRPTRVASLPFVPRGGGSVGCADEVVRYHP